MFLCVITKNFHWKTLTKNLVTFKRRDGVKDAKFKYRGSLKNPIFTGEGGVTKNLYKGTNCLKKGREDLDSLQIKEGTW